MIKMKKVYRKDDLKQYPPGDPVKLPLNTFCCGGGSNKGDGAWERRCLEAQLEVADECARWVGRVKKIEEAFVSQMERLREDMERQLEEGFEEAFQMMTEQRKAATEREKELLAEIDRLQAKVK